MDWRLVIPFEISWTLSIAKGENPSRARIVVTFAPSFCLWHGVCDTQKLKAWHPYCMGLLDLPPMDKVQPSSRAKDQALA